MYNKFRAISYYKAQMPRFAIPQFRNLEILLIRLINQDGLSGTLSLFRELF